MPIAAIQNTLGQLLRGNQKEEEILMKTKRLLFISCLAAGALIASPSFGKPAKKSAAMSQSKATRVAPHTTQVMRHNQNMSPRTGARATTAEPVTMAPALTRPGNTARRVTTAARAITVTIMGAAPAITTADTLTRPTATIPAGRTRTGVTAHPRDITRTHTGAVIRTVVTTTIIRTIHRPMAITDQRSQLCSSVLADSVTTTA